MKKEAFLPIIGRVVLEQIIKTAAMTLAEKFTNELLARLEREGKGAVEKVLDGDFDNLSLDLQVIIQDTFYDVNGYEVLLETIEEIIPEAVNNSSKDDNDFLDFEVSTALDIIKELLKKFKTSYKEAA